MNRWTKTLGAILASALLFTACAPATDPEPDETSSEEVSNTGYVSGDGTLTVWAEGERNGPVELAGQTFHEEELDLADWQGSVVVLNFWYAACPPCRAEAPDLKEVAEDTAESGVEFLGVNSNDYQSTTAAFEHALDSHYPPV